ncbi:glycosyltransferase family 2 protein [Stutzerimonas tarimensis]|uniref:Glycosyltransferase family 2 protein n=1 Tax=Stutzerimonas tarimensis TaxID=1507735 RepID=A0ABV7T9L7_9GAMM
MEQIYAVVLSYKRKDLLQRCLEAIAAQTRRCDGIIVVDNASGEEVERMLMQLDIPDLEVYVASRNIGASGGFSAGFRLAYQRGADFVWMMDDDVIPKPDALEELLQADRKLAELGKPRAFLLSTAYSGDGELTNVPLVDTRTNSIGYQYWPQLVEHGMVPVREATFVSILVPRAALAQHGLPIASMFIWAEDTEFTLRITQDIPGYLVSASKVLHLRRVAGAPDLLREQDPFRASLHRHFVRNQVFVFRKFFKKTRLLAMLLARLRQLAILLRLGQFAKATFVMRGLMESLTFKPEVESADAPLEALGGGFRRLERLPLSLEQKTFMPEPGVMPAA